MMKVVGLGGGGMHGERLMDDNEYRRFCELVRRKFGFMIKGEKRISIHTRLSHRLRILGIETYGEYIDHVERDSGGRELDNLASHITNTETYFFREAPQLEVFKALLAEVKGKKLKQGERTLNILSVGCSTGEEPYTLNILVLECGLFLWDWQVNVTGLDIDKKALERAGRGVYKKSSFRAMDGLEDIVRRHFFVRDQRYVLKRNNMRKVSFRHCNITEAGSLVDFRDVDFIFCRNLLIYMGGEAVDTIVGNLHEALSDDGYLFIGSSESLIQRTGLFVPWYVDGSIVYRKNPGA